MRGSEPGQLTDSALDRRVIAEIQARIIKQSGRNVFSRLFHAKNDQEAIASWKLGLNRILHVFTVRSATHVYHHLLSTSRSNLQSTYT